MQGHIWGTSFILQNPPPLLQCQESNLVLTPGWVGRADRKAVYFCGAMWKIFLEMGPAAAWLCNSVSILVIFRAAYEKVEGCFILPNILWFIRKGLQK